VRVISQAVGRVDDLRFQERPARAQELANFAASVFLLRSAIASKTSQDKLRPGKSA